MPKLTLERIETLERIADAADQLEDWIGKNAGQSDEWPLRLRCDSKETADLMSGMLTKLADALKPYREIR